MTYKTTLEMPLELKINHIDDEGLKWGVVLNGTYLVDVAFEGPEDLMETTKTVIKLLMESYEVDHSSVQTTIKEEN